MTTHPPVAAGNTRPLHIVLTGATGFVGEGVLLECLQNPAVARVLLLTRRPYPATHPKLAQCVVPDFFTLAGLAGRLTGWDACLHCAGTTSIGVDEAAYRRITVDATLHIAETLLRLNPALVFCHISGQRAGPGAKAMWARLKGEAEAALDALPLTRVVQLRPGFMRPTPGQRNMNLAYRMLGPLYPLLRRLWPDYAITLREVALAMLARAQAGPTREVLEVAGIRALAAGAGG